jgi:hypothetical protein
LDLQPSFTSVTQFVQNAAVFGQAITPRRAGRARPRVFLVAPNKIVIDVVHGLLGIGMELVPPNLAVVAPCLTRSAFSEATHITGTNVIVSRSILAKISGEEGVELQFAFLRGKRKSEY